MVTRYLKIVGFLFFFFNLVVTKAFAAAPPNDLFSRAISLTGTSVQTTGTNIYATVEQGEPRPNGINIYRSVWWKWTAPGAGTAVIATTNAGTPMLLHSVYTGDILTNLTLVATNFSRAEPQSVFEVVEGREYKIGVSSFTPSGVIIALNIDLHTLKMAGLSNGMRIAQSTPMPLSLLNPPANLEAVTYYSGTNVLGVVTNEPFQFVWEPIWTGTNILTAQATIAGGLIEKTAPFRTLVVPPNDHFSDATEIDPATTSTILSAQTRFASAEPGESMHDSWPAGYSVWWKWRPKYGGLARLESLTNGAPAIMVVYSGSALTNLTAIPLTDSPPYKSFEVEVDREYHIVLDGQYPGLYRTALADLTLSTFQFEEPLERFVPVGRTETLTANNLEFDHPITSAALYVGADYWADVDPENLQVSWSTNVPGIYDLRIYATNSLGEQRVTDTLQVQVVPENDFFADAIEIPSVSETTIVEGTTSYASSEAGENQDPEMPGSVWYRWIASFTADLMVVQELEHQAIQFYTGDSVGNLTPVPGNSEDPLLVQEGVVYYIRVAPYWGTGGLFRFKLQPPPVNDDFDNAAEFTGTSGRVEGSIVSAGSEPGEVYPDTNYRRSIWYRWIAPETGDLTLSTRYSMNMEAQFACYTGDSITNLLALFSPQVTSTISNGSGSWLGIKIRVLQGQEYYFRLSGRFLSDLFPDMVLTYSFEPVSDIPANDNFAGAILVTDFGSIAPVDNSFASTEPGEVLPEGCNHGNRTLWWKYQPTEAGLLRVVAGADWNTKAQAVFRGTSVANLELIGAECRNDLQIPLAAGETYYIQVDYLYKGLVSLNASFTPAPGNDDFETSLAVSGTSFELVGNNYMASLQPGEVKPQPTSAGRTLWYSWIAPYDGQAQVQIYSSHISATYGVYTGDELESLMVVPTIYWSPRYFVVEEGRTYHIQVDGNGDSYGEFSLQFTSEPFTESVNDHFSESIPLSGERAFVLGSTVEPGEPEHRTESHKSLWWHWRANFTGTLRLEGTRGVITNTTLAVYKGESLDSLNLVAKGSEMFSVPVQGGEIYWIAAAVPEDAKGYVTLFYEYLPVKTAQVPENIVKEPSFEGTALNFVHWHGDSVGGAVNQPFGGVEGQTWPVLSGGNELWQDLETVPGRKYGIQFVVQGQSNPELVKMRVLWDAVEIGMAETPPGVLFHSWNWFYFTATASSQTSRLKFENIGDSCALDGVIVVWLNEPPAILSHPQSRTGIAGGSVNFVVGATGMDPLRFQWYRDGVLLTGRTNSTLLLENLTAGDAGSYSVTVSNEFGVAQSNPAILTMDAPSSPTILLQPAGDRVPVGIYYVLSARGTGAPPLSYQWFLNGSALTGGTNEDLVFASIQPTNSGTYTVRISNASESVLSLPATLTVIENPEPGGVVMDVRNYGFQPERLDAPIFDTDGVTKVTSENCVVQLYAGRTPETLRPVGPLIPIRSQLPGYLAESVTVPNVPFNSTGYFQLRAWEPAKGPSFEVARALGGKFGRSKILEIQIPSPIDPTPGLVGLESFSLEAGLTHFTTGRLTAGTSEEEEEIGWILQGEPGFRYLIEQSGTDFFWQPFTVLTNTTGTIEFTTPKTTTQQFYRSRILD